MRPEPTAPEFSDLPVTTVTPVYAYRSAQVIYTGVADDKILVGAWDAGFCSCFNHAVPNCVMAWCCPWVSLAQITTRLGLVPYAKTLLFVLMLHVGSWAGTTLAFWQRYRHRHDHEQHETYDPRDLLVPRTFHVYFSAWCVLSFFCSVLYVVAVWQLRLRVRDRFQISGSRAWDVMAAACCTCCTIAQIATHVKSYRPGSCDFGPPADTLPAYAP